MTLREQLLQKIEIAPDNLLEELLNLCRSERNLSNDRPNSSTALEAVKRLQTKLRLANSQGQSLVDELISERRSEAENE